MSWLQNVRDAHGKVRETENQMADDTASRKAEGRLLVEDARYRELDNQMGQALSDRRDAWLGRSSGREAER